MSAYLTGLAGAYLVFGLVCALGVVPLTLLTGQAHRASEFLVIWVGFGIPTVVILAVVVGPTILSLNRLFQTRMPVALAALAGTAAGPLIILSAWLMFRDSGESFGGLLHFWFRVPGEFLIGVLPPAAAGAFFCVWLTRNTHRLRLAAS